MSKQPESILVYVGGDRIGDALLKMPVIQGLRKAAPTAKICWVAGRNKSAYKGVLKELVVNQLDEVIEQANVGTKLSQIFKRPFADRSFDIVIDTQKVIRTTLILKRIRHTTFVSPAASFFLSDRKPESGDQPGSVREKLLQLFSLALGKDVQAIDQLPLPDAARNTAAELLPAGSRYFGIAPGAGGKRKIWPLENYICLANQQQEKGRTPVFFLGPDEAHWIDQIRAEVTNVLLPEVDNDTDYPSSPLLSIALAERLAIGISNDAGGGHILAAGGQPLITLFGPTNSTKFADASQSRTIIEARQFGGTDIGLIPLQFVDQKIDSLLTDQ